ncbi:cytochrome P450 [Streptacidiphilus jiangxiensis]|uniref:Cytochrome P450 n=1 Tax=Streptacidiphilus jiangxiensis TaxID=235985 RepID=A0A1H7P0Q9_STRJI|nr:cytochrome P450 [Streptacidiphilus jiangxiensis]SEL29412.1 Cytochrome P450 [Streptacidiphilus jiangxiensis]
MTAVDPIDALTYPAARGGCPFAPPPAYQEALEQRPVTRISLWDGSRAWLVTRHEDVRAVMGDRRFSADARKPGFPFLSDGRRELAAQNPSFIRMDDPEHARFRRMLTGDFIIKRVEALRPAIQRIVDGFLDEMTSHHPPADLVAEFALPVPSLVICMLLGVPYQDHAYFQERSRILLRNHSTAAQVRRARDELSDYLQELAKRKELEPDEHIISKLIARGDLTREEVAGMSLLLLVAGHETTANMTALSTLALLRDPAQLARLREDPTLIKGAVEELLRFLSIVQGGTLRVAVESAEIGGTTIEAGEGVICMLSTANRDSSVFATPEALDVGRDARRHVAFGFGVHQCLGQPLARLELQIALETLIRRLPDLRLAVPFEDVRFRTDTAVHGLEELPVTW